MTVRRNILSSWASHAATLVVGLFLVRYVRDTLGDAGYGAWIFVNSIAGYANLLYLGFGAAVSRYTARYCTLEDWPALNRVLSSVFAVYVVNGGVVLCAAGAVAAAAPWLSTWEEQSLLDVRLVILLLGLNAAIGMWGAVFGGLLVGIQRFDVYRGVQILCTLLRLVLFVAALKWRPSILSMAAAYLAVTVVENVLYFIAARRFVPTLRVSLRLASRETLGECFSFTAFNAVALLSDYLIGLTDTVVIGCVLGTAATVPYYIAQRLCQMARVPLDQIAEVMLPKSAEMQMRDQSDRLRELVLRAGGLSLLLVGGLMIGTVYFGDRVIRTWLGPGTPESTPILFVLMLCQLVALPLRVPKMALMGLGHVRVPALLDLGQAAANLALSLVLIQHLGIIGVAWGTLIPAVLFEWGLLVPYVSRRLELSLGDLWRRGVFPQVLPFTALWAYCEGVSRLPLAETWLNLVLITAIGGGLLIAVRGGIHWLSLKGRNRSPLAVAEVLAR